MEKIQLVLSFGEKKDKLRLKFAKERLSDVKIILALMKSEDDDLEDQTAPSFSSAEVGAIDDTTIRITTFTGHRWFYNFT